MNDEIPSGGLSLLRWRWFGLGRAAALVLDAFQSDLVFFSSPPMCTRAKRRSTGCFASAVW